MIQQSQKMGQWKKKIKNPRETVGVNSKQKLKRIYWGDMTLLSATCCRRHYLRVYIVILCGIEIKFDKLVYDSMFTLK